MNKNLIIGLVVVLLAIGGFVLVQNSSKSKTPSNSQVQDQTVSPSVMEKESVSPTGESMMKKEENTVTLTASGFTPKTITVKAGDEVIWVNKSGATATVNSAQHPTHLVYPKLNLGSFEEGEELRLVFDEKGKYNYHDHLNPSRFGTVVVE